VPLGSRQSMTSALSVNYWPDTACARAFWGQHELPPYRHLLADTTRWLNPAPGERWLDLGCGRGKLTEALGVKSEGTRAEVIGLDCAALNERAFAKLRGRLRPAPADGCLRFVNADFSTGLASWPAGYFDGVVSGLAIQYAESYSDALRRWTTDAYEHLLA